MFLGMLLILIAILGMGAFYCLIAYFLIRLISRKAFKRTLTKYEAIEILVLAAMVFFAIVMIKHQSWNIFLPIVLLMITMNNLRRSNRKYREMSKEMNKEGL
jgi:NhaP-type Na+/H+ or K+/H+ antiporter